MTIILAANDINVDLEELAEEYDRAKSQSERDQVAEDTYALIGGRIKSMIKRIGRGLGEDDLSGFAREAIVETLENSGVTESREAAGFGRLLFSAKRLYVKDRGSPGSPASSFPEAFSSDPRVSPQRPKNGHGRTLSSQAPLTKNANPFVILPK